MRHHLAILLAAVLIPLAGPASAGVRVDFDRASPASFDLSEVKISPTP